jgi:hypothetical protein
MRLRTLLTRAAVLVAAASAPAAAQVTIGPGAPDPLAPNSVGPLGIDALFETIAPTYKAVAQTFVTPAGAPVLQSFRFWLSDFFGGADLRLRGSVYAFDTDHLVGPALYASALVPGSAALDFEPVDFNVGALALSPGATYALVLSALDGSPDGATNLVGATNGDDYAPGAFYVATAPDPAALFAAGAFSPAPFAPDAAFEATFAAAVPEPATVVLVAGGLVAIVGVARRRR